MAVKIRLQRHGRKRYAYYHIVVADSRSPRDGKFITRLGSYNPNTNPATIDIDVDKAILWLNNGAQPTDTANAILRYKGVLYKKHLSRGVAKGSLTQEEADQKLSAYLGKKDGEVESKISSLKIDAENKYKDRISKEVDQNSAKAELIRSKKAEAAAALVAATQVDEAPSEGENAEEPAVESAE